VTPRLRPTERRLLAARVRLAREEQRTMHLGSVLPPIDATSADGLADSLARLELALEITLREASSD
jgi:hypothetical protein